MKVFSKKYCLLAALILLIGLLSGCGSSASNDIKIGMVYELTGNTASYGTSAADGAKLAFKEINANGGVLGKQIKVITADNKGEPSESANAMTKVITQDKVVAVTGFTVSSCGIAGSSVAEDNKNVKERGEKELPALFSFM